MSARILFTALAAVLFAASAAAAQTIERAALTDAVARSINDLHPLHDLRRCQRRCRGRDRHPARQGDDAVQAGRHRPAGRGGRRRPRGAQRDRRAAGVARRTTSLRQPDRARDLRQLRLLAVSAMPNPPIHIIVENGRRHADRGGAERSGSGPGPVAGHRPRRVLRDECAAHRRRSAQPSSRTQTAAGVVRPCRVHIVHQISRTSTSTAATNAPAKSHSVRYRIDWLSISTGSRPAPVEAIGEMLLPGEDVAAARLGGSIGLDVARVVVQDLGRQVQPERDDLAAVPPVVLQRPRLAAPRGRRSGDRRAGRSSAPSSYFDQANGARLAEPPHIADLDPDLHEAASLPRHGRLTRVTSVTGDLEQRADLVAARAGRTHRSGPRARAAPPARGATR